MGDIAKLAPEQLTSTLFKVNGGTLGKQLGELKSYIGRAGEDIGTAFRSNIQDGMKNSFLDLGEVLQKYLGDGKRLTGGNAQKVLQAMMDEVSSPIDESSYLEIVSRAEKLEQLWSTVSQLKKEKPKIYSDLGTSKEQLSSYITDQYTQIGNILSDKNNIEIFTSQINNIFDTISKNLQDTFANILEHRKVGTGNGSGNGSGNGDGSGEYGGSGNGIGSGSGTGGNGANEEEIKRITAEIEELNTQIDQANAKLNELKKGTKINDELDVQQKSSLIESIKADIQTTLEELQQFGDNIPLEKAQRFVDLITTYYELGGKESRIGKTDKIKNDIDEMYETLYNKFDPNAEGDFDGNVLKSYIDINAISQQEAVVSQLTERLRELNEEKKKLINQSGGSGDGNGAESAKVPVEPDTTGFIGKVQEQIDASGETVKVKIDIDVGDNTLDNIKDKLDAIPEKKEVKFSIVDYDNIPLLSDAAGNVQDVFRGTHGVFGNWGMDGISWFTDELQLASQYADNLAEDGKIIRANLSFKNPLEIFGNGADFDKIDISGAAQSVKDMAGKMGFDIKKMLTDDIVQVAKATGYDGVIFRDIKDGYDDLAHNVFAVVDSIQAKNEELYASVQKSTGEVVKLEDNGIPANNAEFNAEFKPIVAGIRPAIEEELANPFDVKLNPDTTNLRSTVEGELQSEPFYIQVSNTDELRDKIDMDLSGSPFEINIQPNNSLIDAINDMLKQNDFSIDINANTISGVQNARSNNADNPYQIIYDMMQADKIMKEHLPGDNPDLGPLKERGMFFNSKTGMHTNPYFFDRNGSTRMYAIGPVDQNGNYQKGVYDVGMHSHPEKFAHMSIGESGDLTAFFHQMEDFGVSKQIIAGRNDVQIFDAQAFYNDLNKMIGGDLDISILREIGKEINNASQSTDDLFISTTDRVVEFLNYVRKFEDYNFDTSSLIKNLDNADYNGGVTVSKAAKSVLRSKEFTNNFLDFVNSDPAYMFDSLEESMEDFLRSQIFEELPDSFKNKSGAYGAINEALSAIFDDFNRDFPGSFYYDNFVGKGNINGADDRYWDIIHRWATDNAWSQISYADPYTGEMKDLHIDWEKYNTYMPIDEFRKKFAGSITPSGGVDMSQLSGQPMNVDLNFDDASNKLQGAIDSGSPYKANVEFDQNQVATDLAQAIGYGEPYYITGMEIDSSIDLGQQIKDKIDTGKPYLINPELDPSSTLAQDIQTVLNSANNSIKQPINNSENKVLNSLFNRVGEENLSNLRSLVEDLNYYSKNLEEEAGGALTNTGRIIVGHGSKSHINPVKTIRRAQEKGENVSIFGHTHPTSTSGMSLIHEKDLEQWLQDITGKKTTLSGDIKGFYNLYKDKGIEAQLIAGLDQLQIFDAKGFYDAANIDFNSTDVQQKIAEKTKQFYDNINANFPKIFDEYFDSFHILDTLKQNMKNGLSDEKDIDNYVKAIDELKDQDIKKNLNMSSIDEVIRSLPELQDYLFDYFSNLGLDPYNIQQLHTRLTAKDLGLNKDDFYQNLLNINSSDILKNALSSFGYNIDINDFLTNISFSDFYKAINDKLGATGKAEIPLDTTLSYSNTHANNQNNSSSFTQEQQVVEQSVSAEEAAFDRLKNKLISEIPEAVDTKTQAFRSEQVEVDNLLDLEIFKLQELSTALQNVFKDNGDNKNFGVLKELFDLLNSLGETEFKVPNMDELYSSIEKLVQVLGLLQDIHPDTSLTDFIAGLKISKTNVDNIVDLSAALETLGEAIKKLGENGVSSPALDSISDILKQADALKSLATILSSTQEKIDSAAKAAGGNSNQDLQELKEYNKAVKEYYDAQQRLQTGKTDTKSRDEYVSQKAYEIITAYEEKLNKLKESGIQLTDQQTNALENAKKKQEELLKLIDDYDAKKKREQSNSIKQEVTGMMKSMEQQIEKASLNTRGKNDAYTEKVGEIRDDYNSLQQLIDSIDWNGKSEEQIKQLQSYLDAITLKIQGMKKDLAIAQNSSDFREANENTIARLNTQMSSWMSKYSKASDYFPQIRELQAALREVGSSNDLNNIIQQFERIKAEAAEAGKVGKSFGETLMGSFRNLSRYLLSFASFYRVIGIIKQTVNTVKELDTALMEVRKVSSESVSNLQKWQKSTFDQADTIGGNAKQIQESTAAWLRLGKSFTEAQEAAQASVKLLNVSEFTSIDDATTSLVSMRQAFDDLSYDDFIDKLNGVGDHFSSSTDQLAQGMRNVSSVLKVAGNDIDQSLALLTAANDITQDMSKASMGVRTVALRISGTQEAKQELEDLGEDVSDFVVQTQSKVDAQVRKYTATAANPNGISVLDQNGRLRSTFDILTDISQVYDEIVQKDNQYGTNTSNALLELLAGKTRSNILASILQNPDVLQNAYKQSQNSQGIGQRELDIYLDSIEAKLAKLQNRLSELAMVTIDSDWLKAIIDLGTDAVSIINDLAKSFGGLNMAVGAIGGIFLQKNGFGIGGLLSGIMQPQAQPVPLDAANFEYYEAAADGIQVYDSALLDSQVLTGEFVNSVDGVGKSLATAGVKAMKFGKGILSTVGTMLAVVAALKLVEAGIGLIYKRINATKIMIENGKEARKNIEEISSAYNDQNEFISKNADEYEKLSKGIGDNNKNISLSEEEYSKFIEMNNKLADMFPQLVTGFDDQGNAIIKLGDGAGTASEQLALLLEQEQRIANFKIGKELGTALQGTLAQIDELQNEADDATELARTYQGISDIINGQDQASGDTTTLENLGFIIKNGKIAGFEKKYNQKDTQSGEAMVVLGHALENALNSYGINLGEDINGDSGKDVFGNTLEEGMISYGGLFGDKAIELTDDVVAQISDAFAVSIADADFAGKATEQFLISSMDEKEIKANWNALVPSIMNSLSVYDGYDELGDNVIQAINNSITSIDLQKLRTDEVLKEAIEKYNNGDYTAIRAYFRKLFLDPFIDMEPEVKTAFDNISKLYEDETISFADRQAKVRSILSTSGKSGELLDLMQIMGWNTPEEALNTEKYNQILDKSGFSKTELNSILTDANFEIAYDLVINKEQAFETIDDLLAEINKVQDKAKEVPSDIFDDLLKDESDTGIKKISETFRETSTAIENFRDQLDAGDETFDPYEMTKTFDEARKSGESYTDYLNRVQLKSLQNFASGYKEAISGLTDPSEIELAKQYIMDLFDTFDWERFNIPDIQDQIISSMDAFKYINSPQQATAYEEQIRGQMNDVLNSQEDYEIFYSLVLTGEDPEELLSHWDDLKLDVELQYKIKDLDNDISNRNQRIARNQAEIDWKDARGELGSSSLYDIIIEEQQGIVDDYIGVGGKVETALQNWNNRKNNKGKYTEQQITKAYTDYLTIEAEAFNAQKQLLDYQIAKTKSRTKKQEDAIRDEQNEQANLLNQINEEIAERGEASDDLYVALADSYTAEAETQRELYDFWMNEANKTDNSELATEYTKNANDAMTAALTAESNAREQRMMPIQNELTELQNQMQTIQAEATKMEEAITKAETNHQKVSAKTYKDLIANGKKQITNLKNQIGIQKGLQAETKRGSKEWYDYQATIDSLNTDISNMQNNITGWSETMTSLVSTNAEALSSALSSAFSEMESGTGMTIDTMNELKKQFSDLKGFNMDNVFYETADGVKMNKSAVEELVDQEYMLQQAILEEALAQENLSAADRVRYEQQLSMLQAIYDQQKANFTGYAEWQTAQSTDNAGKRYEDIQGALKNVQEMYSKGLTGTDDFRSFVSMIDQWGLDTVDAYDRNIEMVKRYVTEDQTGLTNFYSDMVSKGFGTGSAAEGFSLNVSNVEEAARAMGMSAEFMNILLSRAEDYGATNNWVESELDGNLKIQDATQKLIDAKTRLAELEQAGADTTAIEDATNVVQFYEKQVQDYVSNTGSVVAREGQITSAQLRSYQAQMQAIVDEMNDTELTQGMTDQQKQAWQNGHLESLKNLAVEAGVEVDWENIDLQESFKQAYPGYLEAPVTPKLSDVDLSATSDNEEVQSVIQGLGDTTKWTDANTELQGYIDSINEFPYEELKTIDMNDGKWDKGYESAEKSLEGIAKMFGLSRKQADQLVEALHEMGAIGQETETYDKNTITTNMSNLADKGYTSDQVMSMTEEERKKVYVDTVVDDTPYEEWKKDVESTTVQAKVQTALDSGRSAQDMLNMSDTALAQTIGIELDTENFDEQITAARESLQEAATLTVKIDETQFSQLTGAEDVKIGADTSEVTTAIEEAETEVEGSNPKMKISGDSSLALVSANAASNIINNMRPSIKVTATTGDLVNQIRNSLNNHVFTVRTRATGTTSAGGHAQKYTGTMLSPAKVSGTAYNMLNLRKISGAFAGGNVDLDEDEEALVNEVGTESIVRDGQWYLLPGGPHIESLKKGDIVFSASQTEDLLKRGRAIGHGKAYAEGSGVPLSSIPLAPAHADKGKTRQNATTSTWNVKQPYSKTPNNTNNTNAIKDNTKELKKNTTAQNNGSSAIDNIKKWLDKLVDWVDNRIDNLTTAIDRFTKRAENAIGYRSKNADIQKAMNTLADLKTFQNAAINYGTTKGTNGVTAQYAKSVKGGTKGTLLYDTMRGAVRYQQQADAIMNKAVKGKILSKSQAANITKLIQTGEIDIRQYNENVRQVIQSYEDW